MKPIYEAAQELNESIRALKLPVPIDSIVSVNDVYTDVRVRVRFFNAGGPVLEVKYWGNAEFAWVRANIRRNAADVAKAIRTTVGEAV